MKNEWVACWSCSVGSQESMRGQYQLSSLTVTCFLELRRGRLTYDIKKILFMPSTNVHGRLSKCFGCLDCEYSEYLRSMPGASICGLPYDMHVQCTRSYDLGPTSDLMYSSIYCCTAACGYIQIHVHTKQQQRKQHHQNTA